MIRIALAASVLLAGFGVVAQESGGANVRFEQVPNSLTLGAKIYKNDGDRNIETGEILQQQSIVAKQGNGIPTALPPVGFSIVTVCALDFPTVTVCTGTGLPPSLPRFFVDKGNAIGIKSTPDGKTPNEKRINGLIANTTPAASAERMSITFNCTDALCGPRITSGRIVLNAISQAPRTVFLYPTQNGTVVGTGPIVINLGGSNVSGITAVLTSGKATIELGEAALAGLPMFNGFQIGAGSASILFTVRLADMTFGQIQADFVDFACRIDLTQSGVAEPFQFVLPASSSEKFCPTQASPVLKLACTGTIPNYPGGVVSSSDGVVCKISGSQCGINAVLTAGVKSINISNSGVAKLECEAAIN